MSLLPFSRPWGPIIFGPSQGVNSLGWQIRHYRRACKTAGLALYSPRDLRHRYASAKIREGVPVTELAAQLGDARKSMTLDTYSPVLLDDA
jgi:integrase